MRAGALPDIPARPDGQTPDLRAVPAEETTPPPTGAPSARLDRSERVSRLELVRPGITTAATLAHERTLPVSDGLRELVPRGALQRGTTMATHGPGATSLALAMVAEATRQGAFLGVIAPPSFGLAACLDFDIPLRRVVQFVLPETTDGAGWPQLVASVIEGFDLVVLADRRRVTASQSRQLVTRVRDRGSLLVRVGGPAWAEAADLRYDLRGSQWQGLGQGHGHLRSRELHVQAAGRRWQGAGRTRRLILSPDGQEPAQVLPLLPAAQRPTGSGRHAGSDIDRLIAVTTADTADKAAHEASAEDRRSFGASA